jgi:NADH-quinone oxidoreductase subunit J
VLFTELLLPFEVTSVLILIAILGAVALASRGSGERTGTK